MGRLVVIVIAVMLIGASAAGPSSALLHVLHSIQHFDETSLIAISYWSTASLPQAPDPIMSPLDRAEADIVALPPADRDAVLSWLNHDGRAKLYAQGASDADIGPCASFVEPKNCSPSLAAAPAGTSASAPPAGGQTVGGYRELSFTPAPGSTPSGIEIEHGFAALEGNASALTYCVSFRNISQKTAAAITFTYRLVAKSGSVLTAGSTIRAGPISAGAEVAGPTSWIEYRSAQSTSQTAPSNCWTKATDLPNSAVQSATSLNVGVASVTFDDGSHWSI